MVKKTSKSKTKTITPADPTRAAVGYAATLGSASLAEQLSVLCDLAKIVNEGLAHVQAKLGENK